VITSNPRSTVGTSTEIYDYLKLLFARIGKTISPVSGNEVKKDTVTDVVNFIGTLPEGSSVTITSPLHPHNNRSLKEELAVLLQKGFVRGLYEGEFRKIETLLDDVAITNHTITGGELRIVIDRLTVAHSDETLNRAADSVQTAFFEGRGDCYVEENDR